MYPAVGRLGTMALLCLKEIRAKHHNPQFSVLTKSPAESKTNLLRIWV
jgi:hypothetical protein